eukprot:scaffold17498_cov73-Cylindrotheca_fusiformis.AAC.1
MMRKERSSNNKREKNGAAVLGERNERAQRKAQQEKELARKRRELETRRLEAQLRREERRQGRLAASELA